MLATKKMAKRHKLCSVVYLYALNLSISKNSVPTLLEGVTCRDSLLKRNYSFNDQCQARVYIEEANFHL